MESGAMSVCIFDLLAKGQLHGFFLLKCKHCGFQFFYRYAFGVLVDRAPNFCPHCGERCLETSISKNISSLRKV
jgi:hypothetical protein